MILLVFFDGLIEAPACGASIVVFQHDIVKAVVLSFTSCYICVCLFIYLFSFVNQGILFKELIYFTCIICYSPF